MRFSVVQAIRPAVVLLGLLTLLLGIVYPGVVTLVAWAAFPEQSIGSPWRDGEGRPLGSKRVGQPFTQARYLWGRPSETVPPYDALRATPSEYSVINPRLRTSVEGRIAALKRADPANTRPVPVDLVTSSGSGIDPEISLAAADYQRSRIAAARGMSEDELHGIFRPCTHERLFGLLGEPVVNVLCVNLRLDGKLK